MGRRTEEITGALAIGSGGSDVNSGKYSGLSLDVDENLTTRLESSSTSETSTSTIDSAPLLDGHLIVSSASCLLLVTSL